MIEPRDTKGEVSVRPANRSDGAVLGELGALLLRVHHEFDRQRFMAPGRSPEAGYAAFLVEQLDDPDGAIFVAEREAAVIGYVYVAVEPRSWQELRERCGYLHDLVVAPGDRRSGAATLLLQTAIDWVRQRGLPRVVLQTATANVNAQALFTRLGFRPTMVEMTKEV